MILYGLNLRTESKLRPITTLTRFEARFVAKNGQVKRLEKTSYVENRKIHGIQPMYEIYNMNSVLYYTGKMSVVKRFFRFYSTTFLQLAGSLSVPVTFVALLTLR